MTTFFRNPCILDFITEGGKVRAQTLPDYLAASRRCHSCIEGSIAEYALPPVIPIQTQVYLLSISPHCLWQPFIEFCR